MTDVRFTHIGGPTTLVEFGGWRILTDPTFDAPGRTYRFGWGTASTKTTGPSMPASEVGPLDVVLLTHEHHADNLDPAGRTLLPGARAVLTTVSGARRLGGNARGLAPGIRWSWSARAGRRSRSRRRHAATVRPAATRSSVT